MTRAPKTATRAALVLALSSSAGLFVAAPALAAVGDLTGGTTTTPLPLPTVTTSPLSVPLIGTDPSPSPSPTSSTSPSPSPSPSSSSATSPTPTTDPTPTPGATSTTDSASTTTGTTTTNTGGSTSTTSDSSSGSVSSAGTVFFAGGDATSTSSSTQSLSQTGSQTAGLADGLVTTAGRSATNVVSGALGLAAGPGAVALTGANGARVAQVQSRWSGALGDLTLPAIPGGGGVSAFTASPLPGVAPLIASAPRTGSPARLSTRPVLTSSRAMQSSQGDPIGLTLFACAVAAVVAGLSRRRSRAY